VPDRLRLFVAVDPSPEAVRHLTAATRDLRLAGRGRKEDWHVTLAFLGDVEPAAVPGIETALARVAAAARPSRLRVAGSGRFGDAVLWAGLTGDVDALIALAEAVRSALQLGDDRPFRPHLTLARRGRREPVSALRADVDALADYAGPHWPLDRLHLMRSRFPQVRGYETLASWPLAG
jgi:2'-5' RNA ligase